jgi:hypothetical protein
MVLPASRRAVASGRGTSLRRPTISRSDAESQVGNRSRRTVQPAIDGACGSTSGLGAHGGSVGSGSETMSRSLGKPPTHEGIGQVAESPRRTKA